MKIWTKFLALTISSILPVTLLVAQPLDLDRQGIAPPVSYGETQHGDLSSDEKRSELVAALVASGLAPDEAHARIAQLTDGEVEVVHTQGIENQPMGQDSTVTMSVGMAVLIAILLLLL